MKKLISKVSACIMAVLLSAAQLDASSPSVFELSLEELACVVVTDTKVAQSRDSVTQKVEILDAEEIDRFTSLKRNLSDLLTYKSGLFVNTLSRNDANWGSFGGLGPKYNGYLLDGLPIDCFVDTMSLDPWILDRVELYKGPASVMYSNYLSMDFSGNQAPLTGITNFVLKEGVSGPLTRVRLGRGSYQTGGGKFYHQNGKPRFNYFIGGGFENSDYADYGASNSWLNILRDPAYSKSSAYMGASHKFGSGQKQKLSVFAHRTVHDGDAGRPNRDYDHGYDILNVTYANQISEKINLQLKGGYRGYDRYWGEDNFPAGLDLKSRNGVKQKIMPFDFSLNYKHKGESLLTLGMDSQFARYKTYADVSGVRAVDVDASSVSRGLFLQEKFVRGKWILRAGGRLNRISHSYAAVNGAAPAGDSAKSWSRPLWSFGVRYNKSQNMAFYANAGTSFVAPAAKQIWGTASGQIANHDIREETGAGYDLGMQWSPDSKLTLGVRALVNKLDNAIIDNVVSRNPSRSQSVNAGKARSYGVEFTAERKASEKLRWFANLTRISSKVENPLDANHDGTNIPFVPDYTANAGLRIRLAGEVTLSPYVHAAGNYYDSTSRSERAKFGPYQIINLKIQKEFAKKHGYESSFFIDLNNLTDKRYEMPWQFQDTGFNAYIGVEARF